ncbi:MAG: hypothetical protein EXQ53_03845 [Acidobacteria bacterium]|nr:hypothetical protein [Acidobacteriota bacterium]
MKLKILCATAAVVWMAAAPAIAHHSFSAEFDSSKPIKLTGKVSSVRWSNPHAWIYIDVQGDDGKVVNWAFETATANALYRRGWRKDDLEPGTVVVIEGWPARNGTPNANASSIALPNGRRLFAGSASPAEGPPR